MTLYGYRITAVRVLVVAAIVAFLMISPPLRRIVWVILPFGRGWDDVVFWVALSAVAVILWTKGSPLKRARL